MTISVEISYYAFQRDYNEVIDQFISAIEKNENILLEAGTMSSLITGEYEEVMKLMKNEMKPFLEKYPSVFLLKISNACFTCKN